MQQEKILFSSGKTMISRNSLPGAVAPEYWLSVTSQDLDQRKLRWQQESIEGRKIPQPEEFIPQDEDIRGLVVHVDQQGVLVAQRSYDRAQGIEICQKHLLVASNGDVYRHEDLNLNRESSLQFTNPLFNDIHSLRAEGGKLLLTSTGTDAICELADNGELMWSWLATEHGMVHDHFGNPRYVDPAYDHRRHVYDTWLNTTHVNSAIYSGRTAILATLFHQNEIIMIDKETGEWNSLLSGLSRPHALRKLGSGMITFANTAEGYACVGRVSGDNIDVTESLQVDTNWLQDCIRHSSGWLFVDGENSRVIHADIAGAVKATDQYDDTFLLYDAAINQL